MDGGNGSTDGTNREPQDESTDFDPVKFVYFYDKKAPTKAECEADPQSNSELNVS